MHITKEEEWHITSSQQLSLMSEHHTKGQLMDLRKQKKFTVAGYGQIDCLSTSMTKTVGAIALSSVTKIAHVKKQPAFAISCATQEKADLVSTWV
jgi:hypothetical protein